MYRAKISHYWPPLGGPNCATFVNNQCLSGFAALDSDGKQKRWEPWANGIDGVFAAACPKQFEFGTVFVLPGGEVFQCWDRGGKIVDNWLDLMIQSSAVDYGEEITVTIYNELGPHNVPAIIGWPYNVNSDITQGPHGGWYAHSAIDIVAGRGTPVLSPISGRVVANDIVLDATQIIIENDKYMVALWHGDWSVSVGQQVWIGSVVGTEGNNGYTLKDGVECNEVPGCGEHTHINIFDKHSGLNVADPSTVMVKWYQ